MPAATFAPAWLDPSPEKLRGCVQTPPPPPPSQDTPHSVNSWEIFWLKAQPIRLSCCCGCCLEESVILLWNNLSAIKKIKIRTLILTKGKITLDVGNLEFKCCFCVELTQTLFYLKGLMTHMADPESCSVSVRLLDNQGGLAYHKCRRVYCH